MASSLREECTALPDITAEWMPWDAALQQHFDAHGSDLVIVVAVPKSPSAANFFHWLANHAFSVPTLAILAADDELMRMAAEAADDFIVVPPRPGELQQRVDRLLGRK